MRIEIGCSPTLLSHEDRGHSASQDFLLSVKIDLVCWYCLTSLFFFFRYASLPNWILIKRQIELKNRSRASVYTHARDIELKFRERNWLIGLLLSAYLLGLDERTSNFIKLLIHFDPLFCRSFRPRFKFPSKVFSTTANLFHSLNRSTTVHIFQHDVF